MTTSNNERDINELLELGYDELTSEEIERVIDFKAKVKAQEATYQRQIQEISERLQQAADTHMEIAQAAQEKLDALTAFAIQRFEDASNGQA